MGVIPVAANSTTKIEIKPDTLLIPQIIGQQIGPIIPGAAPPVADPYLATNKIDGITHRIGRAKPSGPAPHIRAGLSQHVRAISRELFGEEPVPPMEFEAWLEGASYEESRKKKFRKIHAAFMDNEEEARRAVIKAFVKREKFLKFKTARFICARDDAAKVVLGPIFKSIEHHIFTKCPCHERFIKHVPVHERARHITGLFAHVNCDWTIVENDHTSFETHAATTFDFIEMPIYQDLMRPQDFNLVKDLLCGSQFLLVPAEEPETINFANVVSRNSGEMNTSLGNAITNLISVLLIVRVIYGDVWREVVTVIEGDDGIFGFPPGVRVSPAHFKTLGLDVKMEVADNIGKAGFCSTYFMPDGSCAVVEPMKAIHGVGWSLRVSSKQQEADVLMQSKALAMYYEYPGVPVLSKLGERLLAIYGRPAKYCTDDWYERQLLEWCSKNPHLPARSVPESARVLFSEMFGFSESEQRSLEEHFDNASPMSILDHPALKSRVSEDHRTMFSECCWH